MKCIEQNNQVFFVKAAENKDDFTARLNSNLIKPIRSFYCFINFLEFCQLFYNPKNTTNFLLKHCPFVEYKMTESHF